MKFVKYIVVFLVVAYAAITVFLNYMGDFSYSSNGGYVSASECSSPESQDAILVLWGTSLFKYYETGQVNKL